MILLLSLAGNAAALNKDSLIQWNSWQQAQFERAKEQGKLVLLDLEAVWCHWCHVMDATTYSDAQVAAYLRKHFISIKVDHDARPDLAQRYRAWGWPATIVFNPDGDELVKKAGYIAPQAFLALLQKLVANPVPLNNAARKIVYNRSPLLGQKLEQRLIKRHFDSYDEVNGGLKLKKKFLDRGAVEYDLMLASRGDERAAQMATQTLDAALALIDPAWGGAYQYSTHGDWQHPHYEKIMWTQTGFIRLYALAYSQFGDPRYLSAAQQVADYLLTFLRADNGAFYTSQDADLVQGVKSHDFFALSDKQRRAQGIPRIDRNQYSLENGWAIEALALLAAVSGEQHYLQAAEKAAVWIIDNRRRGDVFIHSAQQEELYFLGDNLAMLSAFTQLHASSGERQWLSQAIKTMAVIEQKFKAPEAGFLTSDNEHSPFALKPDIEENITLVRAANLLSHYSGQVQHRLSAEYAMRFLTTPKIALSRLEDSGILLAASELANPPAHYTVVGAKQNATAKQLYQTALQRQDWYKRIEWWDVSEGRLANHDVEYPQLAKPAGFICQQQRCSVPSFTAQSYQRNIVQLRRLEQ